jgi:hypothetical protein
MITDISQLQPKYTSLSAENAKWAKWAFENLLRYRGIIPGAFPSEKTINDIKTKVPGVLNGSPQEDAGYIVWALL